MLNVTEYFQCDICTFQEGMHLSTVYLRTLPQVGNRIQTTLPGSKRPVTFVVEDIFHQAAHHLEVHRICLYVTPVREIEGGFREDETSPIHTNS